MTMKKLLALILAVLMMASCLVACSGDSEKGSNGTEDFKQGTDGEQKNENEEKQPVEDEKTFERGTMDANGWQSEWMGLKFTPSSDMVMATAAEIESMMQIGADAMIKDEAGQDLVDYALVSTVYEMMASSISGDNVIVMAEKLSLSNMTIEQYITAFKSSFDMTTVNGITFSDTALYTLAGQEYSRIDASYSINGVEISQIYLFKKQEDRVIALIFTQMNEGAFDTMAAMFTAYN